MVWIGPGVFSNALFHTGASLVSRTYCPGVITSLVAYLPLSSTLAWLALREHLLSVPSLLALLPLVSAFHTLEVGHNVFKRW